MQPGKTATPPRHEFIVMKTFDLQHIAVALVAAILAMPGTWSMAQEATMKFDLSTKDQAFIKDAGERQLAGKEMGEIGDKNATGAGVKALAAALLKDYSRDAADLRKIAASRHAEFPPSPGMIDKAKLDYLRMKSSGESFDKAFVDDVVALEKRDIDYLGKVSLELSDTDLKAFAAKNLLVLKKHLEQAEEVAGTLK